MLFALPIPWLVALFVGGAALTVVIGLQFRRYNLTTLATPDGILDLELSSNADSAGRILAAWRAAALLNTAFGNLRLDMVWIVCYTTCFASGCLLIMHIVAGALAAIGPLVASAQILAGLLDYLENSALLAEIQHIQQRGLPVAGWLPRMASWCARLKLHLLTLGLIYLVLGGAIALLT